MSSINSKVMFYGLLFENCAIFGGYFVDFKSIHSKYLKSVWFSYIWLHPLQ